MSDKSDINEALKAAGAPDYMVLIISKIMGAEDAVREMMAKLSEQAVELNQREQLLQNHVQILSEREKAFVDAARDMMAFANKLYGPESELTKIDKKLGNIESSINMRDKGYIDRFTAIENRVAELERKVG